MSNIRSEPYDNIILPKDMLIELIKLIVHIPYGDELDHVIKDELGASLNDHIVNSLFPLSLVCKQTRKTVKSFLEDLEKQQEKCELMKVKINLKIKRPDLTFVSLGYLNLVEWVKLFKRKDANNVEKKLHESCFAISTLRDVDFMIKIKAKCQINQNLTCSYASMFGNLSILKWLKKNNYCWDGYSTAYAALGGHLNLLKWQRKKNCPWDIFTIKCSIESGHFNILEYAMINGCSFEQGQLVRLSMETRSNPKKKIWVIEYIQRFDEFLNEETEIDTKNSDIQKLKDEINVNIGIIKIMKIEIQPQSGIEPCIDIPARNTIVVDTI